MTYPLGDEVLDLRMQCALDTDELARLRRGLQATHQALLDARAELGQVRPVADGARPVAMAWDRDERGHYVRENWPELADTLDALLAAHRATTPSQTPPTHAIVAVERLKHLEEIEKAAQEWDAGWGGVSMSPRSDRLLVNLSRAIAPGGAS